LRPRPGRWSSARCRPRRWCCSALPPASRGPRLLAEIEAAKADRGCGRAGAKQNVAVIQVYGVIAQRANMIMEMCGGTSTEMLGPDPDGVDDPSVRSIVLDIDSPGGSVFGVQESRT
jgi:ClpP class serine protease